MSPCLIQLLLAAAILWAAARPIGAAPARGPTKTPSRGVNAVFKEQIQPLLAKYCYDCHGEKQKGDLDLRPFQDAAAVLGHKPIWEAVHKNVRSREMPPSSKPQPSQTERELITDWISQTVLQADCDHPDPGRVTIRRLNRAEYNNTIRDLIGVDFQPADDFPADDSGYGFDNIGDALSLPPILLEKYLAAAERILGEAIVSGDARSPERIQRYAADALEGSAPGDSLGGGARLLGREGDIWVEHKFPAEGEYALRARAYGQQAGPEPVRMALRLDGKHTRDFVVKAEENAAELFEWRLRVEAGPHRLAAVYLNNYVDPENPDPRQRDRNLIVEYLEIEALGPMPPPTPPESHRRIFFSEPAAGSTEEAAAAIIGRFAQRAYRRPITSPELERLLGLYRSAATTGESFEAAIQFTLQAVLVSPHFLFRGEIQPEPDNPRAVHPINEHALAARLSYFLWSSMPDQELTSLADRGRLRRNLDAQVKRMLRDPKAAALVENFAGQWLQLRNLKIVSPDAFIFPEFDDALRAAMMRETELFFATIIREDRSVLEMLDADYTFVNERLAAHYGIDGVSGEEFARVSLLGTPRGGLLTHASILTLTSNPTRTSPVKRGKWILENILGTPPPPPPPDVPELSEAKEVVLSGTLRQRTEQHRENPNCSTCHERMDPIGFAFENFNAVGGWRDRDGAFAVETEGKLTSGESFADAAELRAVLASAKRADFLRCLAEKMLTYALGRGLEGYDQCAVDEIVKRLERNRFRFSALISGIVRSVPFDQRRGEGSR